LFCLLIIVNSIHASSAQSIFSSSEKVLFFLDISKSSDSKRLWEFLRTSLLDKVDSSLGAPSRPGIKKPIRPTDLSISVINDNSQSAPVVEIVSTRDAERVWGFMINKVGGGKPTSIRLEAIYQDFFGNPGVFSSLVSDYLLQEAIVGVRMPECQKRAESSFEKGNFMDNVSNDIRVEAAKEICGVIVKLSKGISSADLLFSSECQNSSCSDVVGAVQRAAAVADDLVRAQRQGTPRLCIAIASDMLNHYPGVSQGSPWHTLQAIKKISSPAEAEALGRTVAEQAAIKFSSRVKVRVDVIGQGASKNFPRELRAKLDSYWKGFWTAAGVPGSSQKASLDQACK
jgi:hypothetical protein